MLLIILFVRAVGSINNLRLSGWNLMVLILLSFVWRWICLWNEDEIKNLKDMYKERIPAVVDEKERNHYVSSVLVLEMILDVYESKKSL